MCVHASVLRLLKVFEGILFLRLRPLNTREGGAQRTAYRGISLSFDCQSILRWFQITLFFGAVFNQFMDFNGSHRLLEGFLLKTHSAQTCRRRIICPSVSSSFSPFL